MTDPFAVVDLFSGPGGLAEGFAGIREHHERVRFKVVLSIEMEPMAHRTLLLRSFLRNFPSGFPEEYYEFLNGVGSREPDWARLYPDQWRAANDETRCMTLGTPEATTFLQKRIREIRDRYGDRTILLGGPPCQSYSVVGRVRNAGNTDYDPVSDGRQLLYREYAKVLEQLQPAVAVLENVRGMTSAKHSGQPIFPQIMRALADAGGRNQYRLYPVTAPHAGRPWTDETNPEGLLVRAEEHSIPQRRHRVFVVCIRHDAAVTLPDDCLPMLRRTTPSAVSVHDVIGEMPRLRSRLSRKDDEASWQQSLKRAHERVLICILRMPPECASKLRPELDRARASISGDALPYGDVPGSTGLPHTCPAALRDWLFDANLAKLPNNETRGHMDDDLGRYLYASAYAHAFSKSPKAADFPAALAPRHSNWNTGKFRDRFRVQLSDRPATTITSHISKDGHYFIHPDPAQCRSLTVREAARLQTFPDNYFFHGGRTQQYVQVGNAVPPYLARQIAEEIWKTLKHRDRANSRSRQRKRSERTQPVGAQPFRGGVSGAINP